MPVFRHAASTGPIWQRHQFPAAGHSEGAAEGAWAYDAPSAISRAAPDSFTIPVSAKPVYLRDYVGSKRRGRRVNPALDWPQRLRRMAQLHVQCPRMRPSQHPRPGVYRILMQRSDGEQMGFFVDAESELDAQGQALEMALATGWLSGSSFKFECLIFPPEPPNASSANSMASERLASIH